MSDDAVLLRELAQYDIPTHPAVKAHLLCNVVTDRRCMLVTGGTREDRDDCKLFLNAMLATGHFPPFDWLDQDDVTHEFRMTTGFGDLLHDALRKADG